MPGYQAYVIGYMAVDRARVIESLRQQEFDPKGVHVIDTVVVRPNEQGRYVYSTQLSVRKIKSRLNFGSRIALAMIQGLHKRMLPSSCSCSSLSSKTVSTLFLKGSPRIGMNATTPKLLRC